MRVLKFRAWDDDAEHMFYSDKPEDDYFFEFKDGVLWGFAIRPPRGSDDPMEPPEPYCDTYPVMQYTGLKDKALAEIWAGGIAKDRNKRIGVIRFDIENGRWSFDMICHGTGLDSLGHGLTRALAGACEVIGSIHENPELTNSGS